VIEDVVFLIKMTEVSSLAGWYRCFRARLQFELYGDMFLFKRLDRGGFLLRSLARHLIETSFFEIEDDYASRFGFSADEIAFVLQKSEG
jgi:hypothetical protein